MAWSEGEAIALREIWKGRVCMAAPYRVVADRDDLTAVYMAPGSVMKKSTGADGKLLRMPEDEWGFRDDTWVGQNGLLRLTRPGQRWSVLLSTWPPGRGGWGRGFDGWYINLEEPLRRSRIGFDYKDQLLDVLLSADLSTFRWKDEDELGEAIRRGMLPAELERELREEGERAVAAARAGDPLFDASWRTWRPPEDWTLPVLPADWETVA